jgi:hypothetical protein
VTIATKYHFLGSVWSHIALNEQTRSTRTGEQMNLFANMSSGLRVFFSQIQRDQQESQLRIISGKIIHRSPSGQFDG